MSTSPIPVAHSAQKISARSSTRTQPMGRPS